jgi:hypothetical protein
MSGFEVQQGELNPLRHRLIGHQTKMWFRESMDIIQWAKNTVWAYEDYQGDQNDLLNRMCQAEDISFYEMRAINWVHCQLAEGVEIETIKTELEAIEQTLHETASTKPGEVSQFKMVRLPASVLVLE